ncbi:phosphatidylinositide phosphatase SAC2 [Trichoderma asperellum]|uniref:Phosphatidylinositide phosphatase SAC2 n=1 Tax=Trichoderma asperellum TaxID=101201 RepID=A0A6V8QQE2_TRIAP|nr:phosphatidylinositide phosphatase SAC2 [Trichoderma asperellum]
MPGLARKVLIFAAVDGLIIQPLSSKGQKPFQSARIKYGDASISSAARDQVPDSAKSDSWFEALGVVGLITVSRLTYLVTITRREQVAQVFGLPIYVVTQVAVTPCSSQGDAEESVRKTASLLRTEVPNNVNDDDESSSDEEGEIPIATPDEEADDEILGKKDIAADPRSSVSSVAEDVIRRRGSYGRFAQRWFSRSGWTTDQRRTMGMSNSPTSTPPLAQSASLTPVVNLAALQEADENHLIPASALLPKLLRTIQVWFGSSRSFYFSYDLDITRSPSDKAAIANPNDSLYTQVKNTFFWNRHIVQPFIEAGQDALALPLMQGFVGQRTFVADSQPPQVDDPGAESMELADLSPTPSAPSSPPSGTARHSLELRPSERSYLITLISRRSTKRAGLRYLRRGIDEDGYTANFVETEQILSSTAWDNSSPLYSFTQIRGSIPLFFTQTAYALKPVPVLQHSEEANYNAAKQHFERLSKSYGTLQIVNLVEKHGIEEPIGTQYQNTVGRINDGLGEKAKIPFEWFDFHHVCRGMKFENVSHLLSRLKDQLETLGSTVRSNGELVRKQQGVLRTNCMDCLDRTNVCQSSFAKHMLEIQLKEEGIDMSAQLDQETAWFNTLWADNGDAVSKHMVNDYFSQAAIDFLLGNVTAQVFEEFEIDMMTKDPAVSVERMRERAVELCQKRVVADVSEEFHGGWVLITPNTANALKSWPMEEAVLLLTDAAIYLCRFDWDLDKVSSFERVALASITNIKTGVYITSTISQAHMNETRNVGFVVSYQPGKSDVRRRNTRTMSTRDAPKLTATGEVQAAPTGFAGLFSGANGPKEPAVRKLAFKAPYTDSSLPVSEAGPRQTELQKIDTICSEIERLAAERQLVKEGEERKKLVEKGDIISLDAAKRSTGLLEQLGHSLKKLVWA